MDWTTILVSALGGGTVLTGLLEIVKAVVDKKKSPYDMLVGMLEEQKKFYQERNADYEREHRFSDPETPCPVDVANDARLKQRCDRCAYSPITPGGGGMTAAEEGRE